MAARVMITSTHLERLELLVGEARSLFPALMFLQVAWMAGLLAWLHWPHLSPARAGILLGVGCAAAVRGAYFWGGWSRARKRR